MMNLNPDLMMADIPVTSPYYDRLRSLNIQMDFTPYGSPEYHFIKREISELKNRARRRMSADKSIGVRRD